MASTRLWIVLAVGFDIWCLVEYLTRDTNGGGLRGPSNYRRGQHYVVCRFEGVLLGYWTDSPRNKSWLRVRLRVCAARVIVTFLPVTFGPLTAFGDGLIVALAVSGHRWLPMAKWAADKLPFVARLHWVSQIYLAGRAPCKPKCFRRSAEVSRTHVCHRVQPKVIEDHRPSERSLAATLESTSEIVANLQLINRS